MRDDEFGDSSLEISERLLDRRLALRVEVTRAFVEDQQRRLQEQRPGNSESLSLSTTQSNSLLSHWTKRNAGLDRKIGQECFSDH
jgi:hypothetical protein